LLALDAGSFRPGQKGTAMQVEDWLKKIGLAQYAKSFADNGVDELSILQHLTDQDLEKLGLSLGHRRKLLHAIASPPTEAAPPKTETLAGGELPRPGTAERRHLTVMFCDLVGSSALAAKADPEDVREVILAYQTACSGVMPTYDGFVAKFMGDGVLAYFGYPRAHEDDPERAVRAGLDIVAAVGRIGTRSGVKLQVRIGIATGLVVVGDLIGEGASQEQAVSATHRTSPHLALCARQPRHQCQPSHDAATHWPARAPCRACGPGASPTAQATPSRRPASA
jgi:class 3 adenylate cyclase